MKMLALFLVLACSLFAAPPAAPNPKPPVGVPTDAKFFGGKWYRVYLEKLTWKQALEKCKSLGGQLVTVPNTETWDFVKALTPASVWLGATDEKAEGVWLWVDGSPMKFTAWYAKNPDNSEGTEHYLSTSAEGKGLWNDLANTNKRAGFICEWGGR